MYWIATNGYTYNDKRDHRPSNLLELTFDGGLQCINGKGIGYYVTWLESLPT